MISYFNFRGKRKPVVKIIYFFKLQLIVILFRKLSITRINPVESLSKQEAMEEKKRLGEILILGRLITPDQLEEALQEQGIKKKPIGETLIDLNYLSHEQLLRALEKQEHGGSGEAGRFNKSDYPWFYRQRIPIKIKASMVISLIILGMILPISFLILNRQNDQARQRMMDFGSTLVNTYSNYSAEFVLQEDWPSLDPFIREVGKLAEVRYVMILDKDDVIKAHSDVEMMEKCYLEPELSRQVSSGERLSVIRYREDGGDQILDFSSPITYQKKQIGTLHLGLSERSVVKDARELRYFIIFLTLIAVVIGLAISYGAGTLVSRLIASLVAGTRAIVAGRLDYRIKPVMNDELGDLSLAFNEMADGLKKKEIIQTTFGRYVTPEIVDMILSNPEQIWLKGSKKMVTIFFADIRNFTSFAEDREPEEVVGVLNKFFTIATEVIRSAGGNVDKFVGDQVMAVFGAPIYSDDHAVKAVGAAVTLTKALDDWNRTRDEEGAAPIMAGIGVNTGLVVAGNLGSEQRMEYTVIGDDVNLASRLTSTAGPGEIIISERTAEFVKSSFGLKQLETIKVKGKKHPVLIYRVEEKKDAVIQ